MYMITQQRNIKEKIDYNEQGEFVESLLENYALMSRVTIIIDLDHYKAKID